MKEVIDKPIDEVKIKIENIEDIQKVNKLILEGGKTKIIINVESDEKKMSFKLKENRKIDHKLLNLLRKNENIEIN